MSIDRRTLLKAGASLSLVAALPDAARADVIYDPRPGAWRSFQVTTRIEIAAVGDGRQAWVPIPSVNEADWFKSLATDWTGNGRVSPARDPKYGAGMLHVEWADDENNPFVEVTSRIATRDRAIDFARSSRPAPLSAAARALHARHRQGDVR
jgi:hypothetical protein